MYSLFLRLFIKIIFFSSIAFYCKTTALTTVFSSSSASSLMSTSNSIVTFILLFSLLQLFFTLIFLRFLLTVPIECLYPNLVDCPLRPSIELSFSIVLATLSSLWLIIRILFFATTTSLPSTMLVPTRSALFLQPTMLDVFSETVEAVGDLNPHKC